MSDRKEADLVERVCLGGHTSNRNLPKLSRFRVHHGKLHPPSGDVQGVGERLRYCTGKSTAQEFGRNGQY